MAETGTDFIAIKCIVRPLDSIRVSFEITLTAKEWHLVEALPPLRGHLNLVLIVLGLVRLVPHLVGVLNKAPDIVRVDRVKHSEEVLPGWALLLGKGIREVLHEFLVLTEERKDVLHGQLVELRDVDELAVCDGEKLLFVIDDLFEEVFVDTHAARDVQLHYLIMLYRG